MIRQAMPSDSEGGHQPAAERILDVLQGRRPSAALAMELAATLGAAGRTELDPALQFLEAQKSVITEQHAPPDVHLEGCDLRIVALIPGDQIPAQAMQAAHAAAEAVWDDWLRQFLATHRCT